MNYDPARRLQVLVILALFLNVGYIAMLGARAEGEIDANGPYVGTVGKPIQFTVTSYVPNITFFRWDFDYDGDFDLPDQTGCGPLGCWTTNTSVNHTYSRTYRGYVLVEGWDGNSTVKANVTGRLFEDEVSVDFTLSPATIGWDFTAKKPLAVTELGYYRDVYDYPQRLMKLWDVDTQIMLATCVPGNTSHSWNWCPIPPYYLIPGDRYIVSIYRGPDDGVATERSKVETETEEVSVHEYVYYHGNAFPGNGGGAHLIPLVDFKWRLVEDIPETVNDTALALVTDRRKLHHNHCKISIFLESATIIEENEEGDDEWIFQIRSGRGWNTYPSFGHYTIPQDSTFPYTIDIGALDSVQFKGRRNRFVRVAIGMRAIEDDPYLDDYGFGHALIGALCDDRVVHRTFHLKSLGMRNQSEPVDVEMRFAVSFET